ncbi:hypothetical protein [Pedobacter insulae]|uniref:Uncharacterized protein n=1 Tax=Pedobacter insulae TaxID=414048 RepID=A0A1I2VLL2_9SPHI|nr:hypothetical protein [Pedobacter insulae]SFG90020.1 hypothetical protein SAMN04489864_103116 [Pedobacter insulae]
MKKFLIAFAIIIVAHLGCKKQEIGERGPCACSPLSYPYLSLVIKNAAGEDLLNLKTNNSFTVNHIKLYVLDANGQTKNVDFGIRPPFSYGSNQFTFHQLHAQNIVALTASTNGTFYLQLGDRTPYKLNLKLNTTTSKIEKLLVNEVEAPIENGSLQGYTDGNIFYLEF